MKKAILILFVIASVACNSNNSATMSGANNADTVVLTPEFDGQSAPKEPAPPKNDSLPQKVK
jgi:hypothetical protein